jgi:hypothetical protein
VISCPEVIEVEKMPTMAGSRARPDWVGDRPITVWK